MENKNRNTAAIGVFDSGVGGLTVTREIMRQLPQARIVNQYGPPEASVYSRTKSAVSPASAMV